MKKEIETADRELEKLSKIVKDLSSIPDVKDFWIADSGDNVLVCYNGLHDHFPDAISELKGMLGYKNLLTRKPIGNVLSRERLLNYNGYTVLYGHATNGWQLIFFLKKDAYLSLTMFEMEIFLRRIEELLMGLSS